MRVGYQASRRIDDVLPGINVYDNQGRVLFGANSRWFPADLVLEPGFGEFVFEFGPIPLLDGNYPVTVGLVTNDEGTVYDWHEQEYNFAVMSTGQCGGTIEVDTTITAHPLPGPLGAATAPGASLAPDEPLHHTETR